MYIRLFIFSSDLERTYTTVRFLSFWLSGIILVKNRNGDSASPWNITLS